MSKEKDEDWKESADWHKVQEQRAQSKNWKFIRGESYKEVSGVK